MPAASRWRAERQVLVVLAPGDLVHPDAEQPVEACRGRARSDDSLTRSAHRAPRHPAQAGDRCLVHPRRQPRQQFIEVAGQLGSWPGERHALDDDAVSRAAQPAQRRGQLHAPHAQIQMPPARLHRSRVVARAGRVAAVPARQPAAPQHDRDHDDRRPERDIDDVHALQAEQTLECSGDAHGLTAFQVRGLSTSNPGRGPCASRGPPESTDRPTGTRPHATRPSTPTSGEPNTRPGRGQTVIPLPSISSTEIDNHVGRDATAPSCQSQCASAGWTRRGRPRSARGGPRRQTSERSLGPGPVRLGTIATPSTTCATTCKASVSVMTSVATVDAVRALGPISAEPWFR